jgi:EAL domain-containing protein (putative c-di-GMP-specific phosphodiesterase class I)
MLLPEIKEREYRFKLALRMGLPIFALIIALISHTLISSYDSLQSSFYFEAVLLLAFSIYFIFYLIYSGFDVKITDNVSKTFTREYLYKYLQKEIKTKKEYTLILISIDNLNDINSMYGIKNGDKVLEYVAKWIGTYLKSQKIDSFPLGHVKGGDFIIGLDSLKSKYTAILEIMCLKASEFKLDDIEIKISCAITDTSYSFELDYLVENLFELQEKNRNSKHKEIEDNINPNELESYVVNAINKKNLIIMSQNVYNDKDLSFKECFIKLKTSNGKILFPKKYSKVIKKLGLSIDFDLMIIEQVISNCNNGKNDMYAINISPTSLRNEKFLPKFKELFKRANEMKIMFILNEHEYYSHINRYNSIINSLKDSGILIAIDRLGTLHSSFLYLRELNIDVVRFDTYYSNDMKISKNHSIIEGFNIMAHKKGVKTWIKNIENVSTYNIANDINIDYCQGKYLSNLEKIYES